MKDRNHLVKDILVYFLGSAVPMLVLFIRSPIYTRIFTPEEYGQFALVNITFTYLSTLTYSWILSCSFRYYNKYKNTQRLVNYQSVINLLMAIAGVFFLLIAGTWLLITTSELTRKLIIYGTCFFLSEKVLHTLLTPVRLEKKANLVNIIISTNAILAFSLLLSLTFLKKSRIEAFFIAPAFINILYLIALSLLNHIKLSVHFKSLFWTDIKRFLNYGLASLGLAFGFFLLISSDRYIIALYYSDKEVGIYNQVYNLAQISLTAIVNVFQAATNPILFDHLEKRPLQSKTVLAYYSYMGTFIYLPLTLFGSLFANELSTIMLGEEFRVAWEIIPLIFVSAYFSGMTHFLTIRMKFLNDLKPLLQGSFLAAGINIILNLIFIPSYGFKLAAITTLVSYLVLISFYHFKSGAKIFYDKVFYLPFFKLFSSIVLIAGIHFIIQYFIIQERTMGTAIIELVVYLILFHFLTYKINPFLAKKETTI